VEGQRSDQIHNLRPPNQLVKQALAKESWYLMMMKATMINLGIRARLVNPQNAPCPGKSWLAVQRQKSEHRPGIRPLGMILLRHVF
jgi:hypothetical protein